MRRMNVLIFRTSLNTIGCRKFSLGRNCLKVFRRCQFEHQAWSNSSWCSFGSKFSERTRMPRKKVVKSGHDLHRVRLDFNASLREVAAAARVAPSTVLRWEGKAVLPRCPTGALRNILTVLRVRLFKERFHREIGVLHAKTSAYFPENDICGAKTRAGTPCKKPPVSGKLRCRLHGGLSTGPKSSEGRQRCSIAMKKRWTTYRSKKVF